MGYVAVVCKQQKEELARLLPELIAWLRQHGYEPMLDREGGCYTGDARAIDRAAMPEIAPELVIVLGGDGTLLSVARIFAATGTPILGVNLGFLGFLTEVRLADLYPTLEGWRAGRHDLDARVMLRAELWRDGVFASSFEALNEVVVSKGDIARMGDFAVELDGKNVARFRADGFDGLYAGRQRPHPDPQRGRNGGDAHLSASAYAQAHRGARRRLARRPGRGHRPPCAAHRGRPDGRRVAAGR